MERFNENAEALPPEGQCNGKVEVDIPADAPPAEAPVERTAALGRPEATHLKGLLLADMSHRLRTPLNGVIAMIQLALEGDLTTTQRHYISSASTEADALLTVIDNLIDFSRIDGGAVTLDREQFGISEALYGVMQTYAPAARRKGLALLLDVHNDVPPTVVGDRVRFCQIAGNLMDNALKFTETGTIHVEVSPVFYSDRVVGLHIVVKDTGIGLVKARFDKALDALGHVNDPNTLLIGNNGLGLAISNRLIGMMGGCLWLESDVGSGSALHFTVTFEAAQATSLTVDLNELRGANVLVADSNAATRRILQQLLSGWQMRPTLAGSGEEATRLIQERMAAGTPFDLALIDRHMLGIGGSAFAPDTAAHPELSSPVILVLTSITTVSVTDLTREASPVTYVVKPISHSALLKAVSEAMHAVVKERRTLLTQSNWGTGAAQYRVLVAEDNIISLTAAVNVLTKDGYEVAVARNGAQVLAAHEQGGLDLILMDIEMPDITGLEATRLIRQREAASGGHIAILALTAHAMPGDREVCLDAGMDGYVSKPLRVPELRKTVSYWLSRRQRGSQEIPEPAPGPILVAESVSKADDILKTSRMP